MVTKFRAPGMYRAFLYTLYGVALSYVIIRIFREWYNLDPLYKGEAFLELALFLVAPQNDVLRRAFAACSQ